MKLPATIWDAWDNYRDLTLGSADRIRTGDCERAYFGGALASMLTSKMTVAVAWELYRQDVLTTGAGGGLVDDCRGAFFAAVMAVGEIRRRERNTRALFGEVLAYTRMVDPMFDVKRRICPKRAPRVSHETASKN